MRFIRRILPATIGLLLLGACSDLPTTPRSGSADLDAAAAASLDEAAGCVSDGVCLLEPIVVGPGDCDPAYEDCSGNNCLESSTGDPDAPGAESCPGWGGPGHDDPGYEGPGGGGSGGPGDGGDEPPPPPCPDWDPDCDAGFDDHSNDENVDCIDLGCKLRDPTAAELQKVLDAIDSLRQDGFCAEVRANALAMVNRKLQVWDNRVYAPNDQGQEAVLLGEAPWDFEAGGPIMYLWTNSITPWTIAHEAIHGIQNTDSNLGHYYTHSDITPLGMNLDDTARYCSNN